MPDPLISVIIPTVRRPHRLWQAMASVAAQTYPQVELVVINDGGVSIAPQVARYAATFGRPVRAVTLTPGRGVAAARNAGIHVAAGELIAPLDDDDRFRPDHLARLAPVLLADAQVALTYDDIQIQIESGVE
nr:glycosyltransferase family 2 protein [Ktedonobacterales bacterium]